MNRRMQIGGVVLATAYFLYCLATPAAWHFIDNVNLIFHEAGHPIFGLLGIALVTAAGGTLMQLLVPLGIAAHFYKTKQYLSSAITLMWAGQSLVNVYVYERDAITMQLPLLGGDSSMHDWNYMLSALNILSYTPVIAVCIHVLAVLCICSAILWAGYLVFSAHAN